MTQVSRKLVRLAVAQFFGGTQYDQIGRCYRGNGPLLANGLSTVRPYQAKRIPDADYVMGQLPGRGMGAMMMLQMADDRDNMMNLPGMGLTGQPGSVRRKLVYPVTCHVYHMAHEAYAEDAEADIDDLSQAIHQRIYSDFTLGTTPQAGPPMIYQAGMDAPGIRTVIDPSGMWEEIVLTHFRVTFDAEVQTNVP